MGIKNLLKLLNENTPEAIKEMGIKDLKNKRVGIDTSIILYQYITAIRNTGSDLTDLNNKSTSHIMGMLVKTISYLKMGIIPVHVFDGKPPELKIKILKDRQKIKEKALTKLSLLDEIEEVEKIKLLKQSVSISDEEIKEAYEIGELLGVPCIIAPEEADPQLAYLSKNNLIDYISTEDMDLLTFGSKNILKHLGKHNMTLIELDEILKDGDITYDEFIDICILLGSDYTDSIEGIGIKKAWKLIKKYGSIENILKNESKYKSPDNFRYIEARDYFKNLRYIKIKKEELKLKKPNLIKLKDLLINKYNFSERNIENIIRYLRVKYNMYDDYDDSIFSD